ncbi:hypothetical protein BC827DRAFT_1158268 [Russula dissimulans]|nr:hypothetical protein BC827DRAFT_1158268 [Russula dissimulans]
MPPVVHRNSRSEVNSQIPITPTWANQVISPANLACNYICARGQLDQNPTKAPPVHLSSLRPLVYQDDATKNNTQALNWKETSIELNQTRDRQTPEIVKVRKAKELAAPGEYPRIGSEFPETGGRMARLASTRNFRLWMDDTSLSNAQATGLLAPSSGHRQSPGTNHLQLSWMMPRIVTAPPAQQYFTSLVFTSVVVVGKMLKCGRRPPTGI